MKVPKLGRPSGGDQGATRAALLGLAGSTLVLGVVAATVSRVTSDKATPGAAANAPAPVTLSGKADRLLERTATSNRRHGCSRVIVRFAPGTASDQARQALKRIGADVYRPLDLIHSVAITIPNRNLSRLAALPFVERLSSDVLVKKTDEFTVEHTGADIASAPASSGGSGLTGYGMGVAVLDSGVRSSVADFNDAPYSLLGLLSNRVAAAVSFVPPPPGQSATANDLLGHGTHVAGIIAGNGYNSAGLTYYHTFYGIARRAGIVNVRVLDDQGQGTVSGVIAGIGWVVANKARYNIRVLNISLGHPVFESYTTDPLNQAVEAAWKAGIVVVCSAGNDGRESDMVDTINHPENEGYGTNYGSINVPGNDPYVITVGAMKQAVDYPGDRTRDMIATYSSRGPTRLNMVLKPDLVAPGNKVIATLANNATLDSAYGGSNEIPWSAYCDVSLGGNSATYFRLSGTSMATPVVSGAVALLLQKYPTLTPDTVKARLMLSADKWAQPVSSGGGADPFTFGAGYLNIPKALSNTASVPTGSYALSPTVMAGSDGYLYINQDQTIWGKGSLWGTGVTDMRAIWGNQALWGKNVIVDTRAIWGKVSTVQGDRAIWGRATWAGSDLSWHAIYGE